jgi:hypothetical protein
MGMFDSFYFEEGVLPDNPFPPEKEFQTKSLDCELTIFRVDKNGNVTSEKNKYASHQPHYLEAVTAYVYAYDGNICHEYKICIVDNRLKSAKANRRY